MDRRPEIEKRADSGSERTPLTRELRALVLFYVIFFAFSLLVAGPCVEGPAR